MSSPSGMTGLSLSPLWDFSSTLSENLTNNLQLDLSNSALLDKDHDKGQYFHRLTGSGEEGH